MENLNSSMYFVTGDCQGGGIYVRGIKMDPGGHKEMCLTQVSSSMVFYELLLSHG